MRFRADTVIGLLLTVLCVVLYSASFQLPKAPYGTMGPALFPRVILVPLIPMCLALFLKSLFRDLRDLREKGRTFSEWFAEYRNVLASYALFFLFALTLPYAGYLISGFLFLFLMQVALGPKGLKRIPQFLALSVGLLAALFFLFRELLRVILPEGVLF